MVKKKVTKRAPKRAARAASGKPKGAVLAELRQMAEEAAAKHPRGVLSLPGVVKQPRNPKADVRILPIGDAGFVVYGLSDKGMSWIRNAADHSDGYDGVPMFGSGAYRIDPGLVTPLKRGLDAAGLTVTS